MATERERGQEGKIVCAAMGEMGDSGIVET